MACARVPKVSGLFVCAPLFGEFGLYGIFVIRSSFISSLQKQNRACSRIYCGIPFTLGLAIGEFTFHTPFLPDSGLFHLASDCFSSHLLNPSIGIRMRVPT